MNNKIIILLTIILITTIAYAENTIEDDFDGDISFETWWNVATNNASISNAQSYSGTNSARLYEPDGTGYAVLYSDVFTPPVNDTNFETMFYTDVNNPNGEYYAFNLMDNDVQNVGFATIRLNTPVPGQEAHFVAGYSQHGEGDDGCDFRPVGFADTMVEAENNTWYKLIIRWKDGDSTYDAFIEDASGNLLGKAEDTNLSSGSKCPTYDFDQIGVMLTSDVNSSNYGYFDDTSYVVGDLQEDTNGAYITLLSPDNNYVVTSLDTNQAFVVTTDQDTNICTLIIDDENIETYNMGTVISPDTNFNFDANLLTTGLHTWDANCMDYNGNWTTANDKNIWYLPEEAPPDTNGGFVFLLYPDNNYAVTSLDTNQTFIWKADQNTDWCTFIFDDLNVEESIAGKNPDENNTFDYNLLTEGIHRWNVECVDINGNLATTSDRNIWYVPNEAPVTPEEETSLATTCGEGRIFQTVYRLLITLSPIVMILLAISLIVTYKNGRIGFARLTNDAIAEKIFFIISILIATVIFSLILNALC